MQLHRRRRRWPQRSAAILHEVRCWLVQSPKAGHRDHPKYTAGCGPTRGVVLDAMFPCISKPWACRLDFCLGLLQVPLSSSRRHTPLLRLGGPFRLPITATGPCTRGQPCTPAPSPVCVHFSPLFHIVNGACPPARAEQVENISSCHHWHTPSRQLLVWYTPSPMISHWINPSRRTMQNHTRCTSSPRAIFLVHVLLNETE